MVLGSADASERNKILRLIFEQVTVDDGRIVSVTPREAYHPYFQFGRKSAVKTGSDGTRTRDLRRDRRAGWFAATRRRLPLRDEQPRPLSYPRCQFAAVRCRRFPLAFPPVAANSSAPPILTRRPADRDPRPQPTRIETSCSPLPDT
jgi:hypothetical protein